MALAVVVAALAERNLRRERVFRDRLDPLDPSISEAVLRARYRMPRELIITLVDGFSRSRWANSTRRNAALNPLQQMACALHFYAHGSPMSLVGDAIGASKSSATRAVEAATKYLVSVAPAHISMPMDQPSLIARMRGFHEIGGFPGVVGALDGSHVHIMAPTGPTEPDFVNRKHVHSINVQVVCDSQLRWLSVDARFPGNTHDAYVYAASDVSDATERLPPNTWLLGDSGYGCSEHLLTPLLHVGSPAEERYNRAHKRTRCVVERAIGTWKSRWRCIGMFGGALQFAPAKCSEVIVATAVLHNICINARLEWDGPMEQEDMPPEIPGMGDRRGMLARQRLIQSVFAGAQR